MDLNFTREFLASDLRTEARQPLISVLICTYNRSESLQNTLTSLSKLIVPNHQAWELVIVDNNSTDQTAAVTRRFSQESLLNVRYVFEPQQGLSHARNRGIRESQGEILAFTDDDVIVDPQWLGHLLNAFGQHNAIAVGGKVTPLWYCPKPAWFYEDQPYSLTSAIVHFDLGEEFCEARKHPVGANMAFRRVAFTRYGTFRTDLGRVGQVLLSGEEAEFFARLKSADEKVFYIPAAVVYHPVDETRARRRYMRSFYYHLGKSMTRITPDSRALPHLFGAPRHLYRKLFERIIALLLATNSQERVRNQVAASFLAGVIVENRRCGSRALAGELQ